jgi:agmatine/peptidylarginine deiminase
MNKNTIDVASNRRLPAEWEPQGAVILSWPHKDSDWAYMLEEVTHCFVEIARAIAEDETVIIVAPDISIPQSLLQGVDNVLYMTLPTNDTWARDFGPITIEEDGKQLMCDFMFNGWGLKFASDKDNLITRGMIDGGLLRGTYRNCLGFVLEGGSIESDGRGVLLTTSECLLSPNRNGEMDRDEIESYLTERFGLKKVLWLDHGYLAGDDTDSHIDTLARLAPDDTILYVGCDDEADEHFIELKAMEGQLMDMRTLDGRPYNLIKLPMADAIYDEDGARLPATYANFLIMNHTVLMPSYGQPLNDELAAQMIKIAFPNHEVKRIDCRPLIKQHGSLHCVTMQVPQEILPV